MTVLFVSRCPNCQPHVAAVARLQELLSYFIEQEGSDSKQALSTGRQIMRLCQERLFRSCLPDEIVADIFNQAARAVAAGLTASGRYEEAEGQLTAALDVVRAHDVQDQATAIAKIELQRYHNARLDNRPYRAFHALQRAQEQALRGKNTPLYLKATTFLTILMLNCPFLELK